MRRLILLVALASVACFSKPQPSCAFLCGPSSSCPDDYICVAADNRCHLNTSGSPAVCDDTLPIDAGVAPPDSSIPDAAPGIQDAASDAAPNLQAVSVVPAFLTAGPTATGSVGVHFTTANAWPADGKVVVTFPAGFDVSGVSAVATGTPADGGTFTATPSGQMVIVTRAGGMQIDRAVAVAITITGIKNPPVSGLTGTFDVATQNSLNATIDSGTGAAVTITVAAFTSLSVTLSSVVAGATDQVTIAFAPKNSWPADGKVLITFPATFDLTGGVTVGAFSGDGTLTPVVSSPLVTLTRAGGNAIDPTAGTVTINLTNIKNPPVTGATGTFPVVTETAGGAGIDQGLGTSKTITAGALSTPSITLTPSTAGSTSTATISFTTANPWPTNGILVVVFPIADPPGPFDLTAAAFSTITPADGTLSVTRPDTHTLQLTRTGGTGPISGAVSIDINMITNPATGGSTTGTFSLETQTSAGTIIDTGSPPGIAIN